MPPGSAPGEVEAAKPPPFFSRLPHDVRQAVFLCDRFSLNALRSLRN